MIKCIIVDDEPLAVEIIESHIKKCEGLSLLGTCKNAIEGYSFLQTAEVDLMFLDIKMPSISGIDFLRSLKKPPNVIVISAYSEFAITGFELEVIDFILKPVTYERFLKSLDKLFKVRPLKTNDVKDYTYFKISGELIKISHSDLIIAQSVKDYIHLKTKKGNFLTHMTMKYLVDLLPTDDFIRVHRSYLINKNFIDAVKKLEIMIGEEKVPIGENYRANLKIS